MISIIIPVLNEEASIGRLLKHLQEMEGSFEVIVVDGGSRDGTASIARAYAPVIASKRGRAVQMNTGAGRANGDVLLFLHADSLPEKGAFREVEEIMRDERVVGGALRFDLQERSLLYRNHAFWSRLRARLTGIYLGDHGIFVRRDVFDRIGGFPHQPLMEDVELCRRLKREGKLVQARSRVLSSARRLRNRGYVRTVLQMWLNRLLYFLGAPPELLSRFYGEEREAI